MKRRILGGLLTAVIAVSAFFAPSCSILDAILGSDKPSTPPDGIEGDSPSAPEHEHTYVKSVKAPDCVNGGYTLYSCACGASYKEDEKPVLGHTEVVMEGKNATCTQDGRTAGKYCKVCNEPLNGGEIIPAKGHKWSAWSVSGETLTRSCPACNEVQTKPVHTHAGRADTPVSAEADCAECSSKYKIEPRDGNVLYGYYDLFYEDNGADLQEMYHRMYTLCEEFAVSDRTVNETVVGNNGNERIYYFIGDVSLDDLNVSEQDVYTVWKVFYLDTPAYYWLASGCLYYRDKNDKPTRMPLSIDADYAKGQSRKVADYDVSKLREDFEKLNLNVEESVSAREIHDFIANRIDYAYGADGKPETSAWAHNLIGVASKRGGVCEAYAKAYTYLCSVSGLKSLIVTGTAQSNGGVEGHAWNYVKLDGAWYAVDVTWDDQERIIYTYMGASQNKISQDHFASTPDSAGVNYLYYLPELSSKSIVYR